MNILGAQKYWAQPVPSPVAANGRHHFEDATLDRIIVPKGHHGVS